MQNVPSIKIPKEVRDRLGDARRVLVLTGAGVSAESGVPTFRGGGGAAVWKGMPVDLVSSAEMVQRDLEALWEWFAYRRDLLKSVKPNAAHTAIAGWQAKFEQLTVVTQNIDGLHQLAGSREVTELHGNIWRGRCLSCRERFQLDDIEPPKGTPLCPGCGDCLRPDVVLFGELLPNGAFELAAERAANCDLCFVVGTSGLVYPAASLPEIAISSGAYIIEVNPEPTPLSGMVDEVLRGKAAEILPTL